MEDWKVPKFLPYVTFPVRIFPLFIVILSFVDGNVNSTFINFNKDLVSIVRAISENEPSQVMFLFLGLDNNSNPANDFHHMSYVDFHEPQFLFTHKERMPRRSSYAPNQKVASVAQGKFATNYLMVVVLATDDNFNHLTTMELSPLVRVDFDIFIIIGKEHILRDFFLSPFGMGLHTRLGVVYDNVSDGIATQPMSKSLIFLVDPPFYENGKMVVTSYLFHFPNGAFTLNGRKLRVSANTLAPYIIFDDEKRTNIIGGTHYGLLALCAANYNFSLEWDIDPTRGNGKLAKDGSASGMLGDVLNGKADIAFIARLTRGQVGVIDLTTSNYIDTLVFLSRNPEARLEWTAAIHIFTLGTWGIILLVFVGVIPLYYLQLKLTAMEENMISANYSRAVMIPFGILLTQSVPKIPNKAYVLTLFWMLFVLNLNIAYNSNLSSFMTKLNPEPVPSSFEELADRLDYNISFNYINNGSCDCFYFFNDSMNPLIIGIQERFMDNLIPDTGHCIIRAVLKPKNVCIGWESVTRIGMAKNATLHAGSSLVRVSASVHSSLNSIGFQRHSVFTRRFDKPFGRLRDMGIVMYFKRQAEAFGLEGGKSWLKNRTDTKVYQTLKKFLDDTYATVKPFTLSNFTFSFLLLFGGLIVSGAFYIMELLTNVQRPRRRKKSVPTEFMR